MFNVQLLLNSFFFFLAWFHSFDLTVPNRHLQAGCGHNTQLPLGPPMQLGPRRTSPLQAKVLVAGHVLWLRKAEYISRDSLALSSHTERDVRSFFFLPLLGLY
jgi:hypothetical protein